MQDKVKNVFGIFNWESILNWETVKILVKCLVILVINYLIITFWDSIFVLVASNKGSEVMKNVKLLTHDMSINFLLLSIIQFYLIAKKYFISLIPTLIILLVPFFFMPGALLNMITVSIVVIASFFLIEHVVRRERQRNRKVVCEEPNEIRESKPGEEIFEAKEEKE